MGSDGANAFVVPKRRKAKAKNVFFMSLKFRSQ